MPLSRRARILQRLIPVIMPSAEQSPEQQRARLGRVLAIPDRHVQVDEIRLGGVPVLQVRPTRPRPRHHLLHVHGGGFVIGSPRSFQSYLARLARRCDAVVLSVDYRLAPEHPYPAAIDDCMAAYQGLLEVTSAADVALVGESAGGNAVLAMLVRAREQGLDLPSAAVLLSPWLDLTFSGESITRNAGTELMLGADLFTSWRDAYVGDVDPSDPGVSPLFADLSGLPPLHVQATTAEVLEDDARRLVERAHGAGVEAELVLFDELWHVFPTLVPLLPEAGAAIDRAVAFLRAQR